VNRFKADKMQQLQHQVYLIIIIIKLIAFFFFVIFLLLVLTFAGNWPSSTIRNNFFSVNIRLAKQ